MAQRTFFKLFFTVMGIYDVLLGGVFVLFYVSIYAYFKITLPNHPGYIYVPALFIIAGGIGEFLLARNLLRNIDLAVLRMLMKLSFASAIIYSYFRYGVPQIFLLISVASIIGIVVTLFFISWATQENLKLSK